MDCLFLSLLVFISNNSDDEAVKVVEEKDQVESELGKALILMTAKGSENLSSIEQVRLFVKLAGIEDQERKVQK